MNEKNNNNFVVTARKWRPVKFSEVVGQEHITTTLKNAILSNRVHHAYLFSGPRGVGKTTTARIYARAVNYPDTIEMSADELPKACHDILTGRSMDVIEIDGASNNSVDDIRSLRENSKYPPSVNKFKIYIIDEVHMLSTSAFNALLKTLEEPPKHLLFVFATTEIHKLPATILSRCQRFDFKRMTSANIIKQLDMIAKSEEIKIENQALITIAKKADGSMRDAQSIFDQVIAFCGKDIKYSEMADALHLVDEDFYFRITDAIFEHNNAIMFELTKELAEKGYDLKETLEGLLEHLRDITSIKVTGKFELVEATETHIKKYEDTVSKFSKNDLVRLMTLVNDAVKDIKYSSQPRIRFELALNQLASINSSIEYSELIKQINELKKNSNPVLTVNDEKSEYSAKPKKTETKKKIDEDKKGNDLKVDPFIDKWRKFIKSNDAKEFSAFISQVLPTEKSNVITLSVDSKFIYDILVQNEIQITNAIKDYFGNSFTINFTLDEEHNVRNETFKEIHSLNKDNEEVSSKNIGKNINLQELHPVERKIVELFNAEKIS